MHAPILALVTVFAASVAAAPLPITPIESPVEGLAVRDAEAALSQAQMDVLKRSIFERLEEIVPVKRDYINGKIPTHGLNDRDLNLRQGDLHQVGGSVNAKSQHINPDKSQVDEGNTNAKRYMQDDGNDKRSSIDNVWNPDSVEKRSSVDNVWNPDSVERRSSVDNVWNPDSVEKRSSVDNVWNPDSIEKRSSVENVWNPDSVEKRSSVDNVWNPDSAEKRSSVDNVWNPDSVEKRSSIDNVWNPDSVEKRKA